VDSLRVSDRKDLHLMQLFAATICL